MGGLLVHIACSLFIMMNKKLILISALLFSFNGWAYSETDLAKLKTTNACKRCDLSVALLADTNLSGAILTVANLRDADLRGADLSGANLRDADLRGADLSGANLSGANLRGASLSLAQPLIANLRNANLTDANLTDAYLASVNLSGANLSGANLTVANLRNANLTDANLTDAYLASANLSGADLSGADLSGANLSGANLTDAIYDLDDAEVSEDKQNKNRPRESGSKSATERLSDLFYFLYENMTLKNTGLVFLYLFLWLYLVSWKMEWKGQRHNVMRDMPVILAYVRDKYTGTGFPHPFYMVLSLMNIAGYLFLFYLLYLLFGLISEVYPNHYANASFEDPYGFVSGFLHGLFILIELLIIIFSNILTELNIDLLQDLRLIGWPNTGFGYGLGYLFGLVTFYFIQVRVRPAKGSPAYRWWYGDGSELNQNQDEDKVLDKHDYTALLFFVVFMGLVLLWVLYPFIS